VIDNVRLWTEQWSMDVQADAATDESMDGRKEEHKYDDL
jgi:hypothetical protein